MTQYLIIQTVILLIASMFIIAGNCQGCTYDDKWRSLYHGIGVAIISIFALDLFAIFVYKCMIPNIQ